MPVVKEDKEVGGYGGVPPEVRYHLNAAVEALNEKELKHGSTALFWHLVHTVDSHITVREYIFGIPVFHITKSRQNNNYPDSLLVSFECDCGHTHTHGWSKNASPTKPQHQVAHCASGPLKDRGYYIVFKPVGAA